MLASAVDSPQAAENTNSPAKVGLAADSASLRTVRVSAAVSCVAPDTEVVALAFDKETSGIELKSNRLSLSCLTREPAGSGVQLGSSSSLAVPSTL